MLPTLPASCRRSSTTRRQAWRRRGGRSAASSSEADRAPAIRSVLMPWNKRVAARRATGGRRVGQRAQRRRRCQAASVSTACAAAPPRCAQRCAQVIAFEPDLRRACGRPPGRAASLRSALQQRVVARADRSRLGRVVDGSLGAPCQQASRTGAKLRRCAGAGAVRAQRGQVLGRRIALVAGEAVLRVQRRAAHGTAGRGAPWPGSTPPRSPSPWRRPRRSASAGTRSTRQPVAVDQHLRRQQAQALDRAAHRQHRGLQDVQRVDLLDAGLADAAAQRLGADLVVQPLARAPAVSTLESARPAIGRSSSRITAAATTGPASGPRPASSTPATRPGASQLEAELLSACEDLRDGIGGRRARCRAAGRGAVRSKRARQRLAGAAGVVEPAQRGFGQRLRASRRPAAARARRSRGTGCWAGPPRAGSACAS